MYREDVEPATRKALDDFLAEAWEFRDELADEDLMVARRDEIAATISKAVIPLTKVVVVECLQVIAGVTMPDTEEFEDELYTVLYNYFLE